MPAGIRSRSGFAKRIRGLPVTGSMKVSGSVSLWDRARFLYMRLYSTDRRQLKSYEVQDAADNVHAGVKWIWGTKLDYHGRKYFPAD